MFYLEHGWTPVYDVSAGVDLHALSQNLNPFNGDCHAPPTWFSLGNTEGILAAVRRHETCIYVDEYDLEYGELLHAMAAEYGGADVRTVRTNIVKPVRTVMWFNAPPAVVNPHCCEMHLILAHAKKTQDPFLNPLLVARVPTSGHMSVQDLYRYDHLGGWDDFVHAWVHNTHGLADRVRSDVRKRHVLKHH